MSRIFLSHSSRDNFEAIALRDWLASQGFDDVFLDLDPTRGIAAGERWERALHKAATRCEAVIFLVSANWLASGWCLQEYALARGLNKKLFALHIDAQKRIGDLPPELTGTWQVINLAGGQDMQLFRVHLPGSHEEKHVGFGRDGLRRLKLGLEKAGLDPKFFAWPPQNEPDRAPYRGLKPLKGVDAGIFFGRDAPIVEAADRLRGMRAGAPPRLLVILGASGAGKSSFLRAGLLPRLSRDDSHFLTLPSIRPERAALSGQSGLLGALEAKLPTRTRAELRAAIRAGATGLRPLLAGLVAKALSHRPAGEGLTKPPAVVIAIDQAEELFRAEGAAEGAALLELVRDLTLADDPAVIATFAIRSDAYDALQNAKPLEGLKQETLPLLPMPRGAFVEVIAGPARRLTEAGGKLVIEPQLTQRLLEDIEKGGGSDALPLLAFTLEQLYLEYGRAGALKLADYQAFGGLKGAIDAAVERAFARAAADSRIPRDDVAREALLRRGLIPWLAGIDPDTKSPRRIIARRSDIPSDAAPLIDLLVEERLLSTDTLLLRDENTQLEARIATVEPAHEALSRQWGLLRGWLTEDLAILATLEGVRRAARDWDVAGRARDWLAHRGQRLAQALALGSRPDIAAGLDVTDRDYLSECEARYRPATPGPTPAPPPILEPELSLREKYLSVIALVRSGATAFAQKRFDELGLDQARASGQLQVDIGSLAGRLAKDRALANEDPGERAKLLNHAADTYETVFQLTRSDYPLVNVAALRLWAGDRERSRLAAQSVLDILAEKPPSEADYWHLVTRAEAHLLIGDEATASLEVEAAARLGRKAEMTDWDAFASTARQLKRSCRVLGVSEAFLSPLRVPPLIVYAGDRPGPRLAAEHEPALAAAIRAKLAAEESHIGVGGLAAGADILFAEALLARGADLHVVLAFPTEMFVFGAVAPYGTDWVERFNRCLAKAKTVKHATNYGYQGHATPLRYACRLAMGQAILRARSFDTSAIMLAACDADLPLAEGVFDPVDDVAFWSSTRRRAFLIRPDGHVGEALNLPAPSGGPVSSGDRVNAAVLFGDLHGFSRMPESSVLKYADLVLGGIGEVFDRYAPRLLSRNSWGDAIFAQFDDASAAAHCAVDLQNLLRQPSVAELDPGVHMSLRIGLHYGPVQKVYDRIQERVNYMGIHVVEAARIEPIAVPGMIYVSEAFALALAIDAETDLVCEYLGEVDTAKRFGKAPLYELRRRRG